LGQLLLLGEAITLLSFSSQLIANYLEAFGTIGAVIVALFVHVYLAWRKRPHLMIAPPVGDTSPESTEDFVVIRSANEKIVEFWVRLRVCAKAGKRTARNVQARVAQVRRLDGPQDSVVPSGPLIWSSVGPTPQSILSGSWLRLDILRYRIEHPIYRRQLEVEVGYEFDPKDMQTVLGNGRYELDFLLGADDIDTSHWRLTFEHNANPLAATDEDLSAQIKIISLVELRRETWFRRLLLRLRP
jgi:hypothetical protein